MALLDKDNVINAFNRMGQLAKAKNETIELVLLGGSLMVLVFGSRQSTRDVDVVIQKPREARIARDIAQLVAVENGWSDDWLNDAAKGFMVGISDGPIVFSAPGIIVRRPDFAQLLAMKLCAWRDDVDILDAKRILCEMTGAHDEIWEKVRQYLQPGKELKAKFAFEDLWEEKHE